MIDDSALRRISSEVGMLMNEDSSEENQKNLLESFYSLIEELGYTDSMIVTPGALDEDGNEVEFQIALKTDAFVDESVKAYVKFVDKGEDILAYEDLITRTANYEIGVNTDRVVYFIICNLIAFKIYRVEPSQTKLFTLDDSYDIVDMTSLLEAKYLLELLQAVEEDSSIEEDTYEPIKEEKPPEPTKEKKIIDKDKLIKIGLIATGVIFIFLIISFLFKGSNDDTPKSDTNISNTTNSQTSTNTNIDITQIDIPNNQGTVGASSEAYLTIKAVLDTTVTASEVLNMSLISDLEKGAIVKLGIFCGNNTEYKYITIDANGQGKTSFNIPSTWGDEKITVGAYLKFNEKGYSQPSNVTNKYGESGEYISWNANYSKDMLTYSSTTHSNALVIALKEQAEKELAQQLSNTIRKDFQTIDTRVDNFGNIKHVPKGYSFDQTNISENTHIYPMIFYDAQNKKSYFYIICGYVGTQFYRFDSVGFSADGYAWTYEIGTNPSQVEISGNKKAEWVYYNNVDSSVLLGDMSLFANSNDVTINFIGTINTTFSVTSAELADIQKFLYIYETYYGNGTMVPQTSWFSLSGTEVKLNYIQSPLIMLERGSKEIASMNQLASKISSTRLNGGTISVEDSNTLAIMDKTYRKVSETIYGKIIKMIQGATATTLYNDDYETNKNYMKIYFKYKDGLSNIEAGYIPYINIYDDYSVIVPIKTITNNTTAYDEVYAKFYITESLYNELEIYFDSKAYEQID